MEELYTIIDNLNAQLVYKAIKEKEHGCEIKIPINVGNKEYNTPKYDKHKEYLENILRELPQGYKLKVVHKSLLSSSYTEEDAENVEKYSVNFPMEDIYTIASIDRRGAENIYKEAERFAQRVLDSHREVIKQIFLEFRDERFIEIWADSIYGNVKYRMFRDLGVKNLEKPIQKYGMAIALAAVFKQCNKKQYKIDVDNDFVSVEVTDELLDW